jgi:hypothetical protein
MEDTEVKVVVSVLLSGLLSGCTHSTTPQELQQSQEERAARMSVAIPLAIVSAENSQGVILPVSMAPALLEQCSRGTLGTPDGYWLPDQKDIQSLEAQLPLFLGGRTEPKAAEAAARLQKYHRQYAGFVRNGHKTIYVNLFPADEDADWQKHLVRVCDGGPWFFGVEFDVDSRTFIHIAFNGYA